MPKVISDQILLPEVIANHCIVTAIAIFSIKILYYFSYVYYKMENLGIFFYFRKFYN